MPLMTFKDVLTPLILCCGLLTTSNYVRNKLLFVYEDRS